MTPERKRARISLRRIIWKRAPTAQEIERMEIETIFGPTCFAKGREWLFVWPTPDAPRCYPPTPEGYTRISP